MSEYICKEDLIKAIENDCPNFVYYSKKEAIACIEAMNTADVEPRTDLGALATARAIELLTASMDFLQKMKETNGCEDCMSILCEYDDTLNDGYCLLRNIEDFFEIVEDEE